MQLSIVNVKGTSHFLKALWPSPLILERRDGALGTTRKIWHELGLTTPNLILSTTFIRSED